MASIFSLRSLGSLKLALAILVLLGVAVPLGYRGLVPMSLALAVPLLMFAVNLVAAVLTQPAFRAQPALLAFHLALLAVVVLAAIGRLTYLQGGAEVTVGRSFDGGLEVGEAGPLHPAHYRHIEFVNEGFEVEFDIGRRRAGTTNRVSWVGADGQSRSAVIGDNTPLVIQGYRFYPSPNNGFAALFRWTPAAGGESQVGLVNFPAYPMFELRQSNDWVLPDGSESLWVKLEFDADAFDPARPFKLAPPQRHWLILRSGERRQQVQPGESVAFATGTLTYLGLTQWMGYVIHYDPTSPWLLAASVLTTLALGWHFWTKFRQRPWQQGN